MISRFFDLVWPDIGVYALAIPAMYAGKTIFKHKTFQSKPEAIKFAMGVQNDLYFCVHSLKEPKVWNPRKLNRNTGNLGAYEVRTQQNMLAARCLFADIDVGNDASKYQTQAEALAALKAFCSSTKLPAPTIVSSGSGLHVYWGLTSDIQSDEWTILGKRLQALANTAKLKVDKSRTSDCASILRVPGSFNTKRGAELVRVLRYGVPHDVQMFDNLLPPISEPTKFSLGHRPDYLALDVTNITDDRPKPSAKAIISACKQMQYCITNAATLPEPTWYAAIALLRHCDDGVKAAHKISAAYPAYSAAETDSKLWQLESKAVGPTTCERFDSLTPDICATCRFKGMVRSPIMVARKLDALPPPKPTSNAPQLPNAPHPYTRKADGVFVEVQTKEDVETIKLLDHDFYPLKRMKDDRKISETHIWVADLPLVGKVELAIPADAMYDSRKLSTTLSNRGVFANPGLIPKLGAYMTAYIKRLQAEAPPDTLHGSLGWTDEFDAFVMPDKMLKEDGSVVACALDNAASTALAAVHKRGSADTQIELLQFFCAPEYVPNQFVICAALGAPLFYMTGHHGVIVNMTGPPGASKSTTLYTSASLWGHPEKYTINGTTRGATANARDNRIMALSNLPVAVDEITRMPAKDMADMAMAITQSEGRIRLDVTGAERKTAQTNKATIMLCTANTSLYTALSNDRADSTAESVRVLEIQFNSQKVHAKHEADTYLDQIKQNYGHIGEMFIEYVARNRLDVQNRVRNIMRAVDQKMQITSGERFWSATAAVALAACEIASELGLLRYDVRRIWAWLVTTQIPAMRGQMMHQYSSPVTILADYLEYINGNMLVLQKGHHGSGQFKGNIPVVIRQPNNAQLLARHEIDKGTMWVQRKSFKDYCFKYGHNYTSILAHLTFSRVIHSQPISKVLGAGTDYAKGQVVCLMIDMTHPDLSGEIAAQKLVPINQSKGASNG